MPVSRLPGNLESMSHVCTDELTTAALLLLQMKFQNELSNIFPLGLYYMARKPFLQVNWEFKVDNGILEEALHILQQIDPTVAAIVLLRNFRAQVHHAGFTEFTVSFSLNFPLYF